MPQRTAGTARSSRTLDPFGRSRSRNCGSTGMPRARSASASTTSGCDSEAGRSPRAMSVRANRSEPGRVGWHRRRAVAPRVPIVHILRWINCSTTDAWSNGDRSRARSTRDVARSRQRCHCSSEKVERTHLRRLPQHHIGNRQMHTMGNAHVDRLCGEHPAQPD